MEEKSAIIIPTERQKRIISAVAFCGAEHPILIDTREQYNENFEILGVSLDANDQVWHQAVLEDQLTWINTCVKGDVDKLAINFIHSNFLLDPTGRIQTMNITARELKVRLDTELNREVDDKN
ncbi:MULTISPECIES: thioredoxin-like domain-containing protein [Sphingobacterium]|uniref:Thioredoxin-like domain-containing protein n=1 Tax=Sphingobacterium populi TaxID=1812824 RepID=A0ABW5U903_9SPHI|nr:thioredoxin-like domain-containing protein [Sphingobacterium sp. CFCC 11742]